uniref:Uncharacterized protein n=1 Tax=Aegilops tauschii subsp. strangulata TaxID=200361 RepID=A0A453TA04_AEGTS
VCLALQGETAARGRMPEPTSRPGRRLRGASPRASRRTASPSRPSPR